LPISACKGKPQKFTTTVEVMQVRTFGGGGGGAAGGVGGAANAGAPGKGSAGAGAKLTDLDLKYVECPGNARQILRAPREFSECGTKLKVGDKVKADVTLTYNPERGTYRSEITHLGACDLKMDMKDEANYQTVENCSDVKASGSVVGVRCDRLRSPELLAKCPWLRRN
jgi:hypothetical protein